MQKDKLEKEIGYSFNNEAEELQDVMKEADIALYKSKAEGKNCITPYSKDIPILTYKRGQ